VLKPLYNWQDVDIPRAPTVWSDVRSINPAVKIPKRVGYLSASRLLDCRIPSPLVLPSTVYIGPAPSNRWRVAHADGSCPSPLTLLEIKVWWKKYHLTLVTRLRIRVASCATSNASCGTTILAEWGYALIWTLGSEWFQGSDRRNLSLIWDQSFDSLSYTLKWLKVSHGIR